MAIVVLVVGALLTLLGIAGYIYGTDSLPTERGVAVVISSAVVFSAGMIVLAIGLLLQKLEAMEALLSGVRGPVKTPAKPSKQAAPERAGVEIPAVVPLLPPDPAPAAEAADKPVVAVSAPKPKLPKAAAPALKPQAEATAAGLGSAAAAAAAGTAAIAAELLGEKPAEPVKTPAPDAAVAEKPVKDAVASSLDALTERLRAPLELPKMPVLDVAKAETPRADLKIELPKIELPKVDLPKIDLPKVDLPKVDLPRPEALKIDLPKLDLAAPAAKPVVAAAAPAKSVAAKPVADADDVMLADRSHEIEYKVETLEPVITVATPPAHAPAKAEAKPAADPLADFEGELEDMARTAGSSPAAAKTHAPDAKPATKPAPTPKLEPVRIDGLGEPVAKHEPAKHEPAKHEPAKHEPVAPEPAADPHPAAKPAVPTPGAEIVGAYESGGAKYTMYSDGSVVAEAGGETLYFKSLEELRDFIDAGVKS